MQAFKKFLLQELIFTAIISTIAVFMFNSFLKDYYLPVFWGLLALIASLTGGFHYSLLQIEKSETGKFSSRFMMFSGIKMIIYLVVLTSYVFIYTQHAKSFLVTFFIIYLLYTVFEVIVIVKYLKKK